MKPYWKDEYSKMLHLDKTSKETKNINVTNLGFQFHKNEWSIHEFTNS